MDPLCQLARSSLRLEQLSHIAEHGLPDERQQQRSQADERVVEVLLHSRRAR